MSNNQPNSIAVFLGPSMSLTKARKMLAARYLPPAKKGDIYSIMASGVKTILLVDGMFHDTPSLWPREIIHALEEGIRVIGAASIGAIRAAELYKYGMIGLGQIFEWYRDEVIDGDDEVAIRHATAEFGFRPLSVPMVNIRSTLQKAVRDQVLDPDEASGLLDFAKDLYYPERSYHNLFNSPILISCSEIRRTHIQKYISSNAVDLKDHDTAVAMNYVAKLTDEIFDKSEEIERSVEDLWSAERVFLSGIPSRHGIVSSWDVFKRAEETLGWSSVMRRRLSIRCFILLWAESRKIDIDPSWRDRFIRKWETNNRIQDRSEWCHRIGLTIKTYLRYLADSALVEWISIQGPTYFGVPWRFEEASEWEFYSLNVLDMTNPRFLGNKVCEPSMSGNGYSNLSWMWRELSQRKIILEWAKQNGIVCPSDVLTKLIGRYNRADMGTEKVVPVDSCSEGICGGEEWLVQRITSDWIIDRGPNHFGILWAFEDSLMKELQVTGRAAELANVY